MKNKLALALVMLLLAGSAQAGPSVVVWVGGCPQPMPMQPMCNASRYYQPCYAQPVVYAVPACYNTTTRFSNVNGFVNGGQGIIQVSQPVYPVQPIYPVQPAYPVQPVIVSPQNTFRWR